MNVTVSLQKLTVYLKEKAVGKAVLSVFLLGEGAGEVEVNSLNTVRGDKPRQIFRAARNKAYIGKTCPFNFLNSGNNNISVFFNGNEVYVGTSLCHFAYELTLAAADFKVNGIAVSEKLLKIEMLLYLHSLAEISFLSVGVEDISSYRV